MNSHAHLVSAEPRFHSNKLVAEMSQDFNCDLWQGGFLFLKNTFGVFDRGSSFSWEDDTKFCEQAAKHIAQLCSLPDDRIAGAMQKQNRLLFFGLGRDKPHRRACHRFADSFSIIGVRFAAFDIGLHIIGWDQANLVPELSCPIMAGSTCLHANQTRFWIGEELHKLGTPDCSVEDNLLIFGNRMDLKNMFGQINADSCNLHWVAPFPAVIDNCRMAHCDAGGAGATHPIRLRVAAPQSLKASPISGTTRNCTF